MKPPVHNREGLCLAPDFGKGCAPAKAAANKGANQGGGGDTSWQAKKSLSRHPEWGRELKKLSRRALKGGGHRAQWQEVDTHNCQGVGKVGSGSKNHVIAGLKWSVRERCYKKSTDCARKGRKALNGGRGGSGGFAGW